MTEAVDVTIAALGAQGDGIVSAAANVPTYVPFALPGERWRISEGEVAQRLSDSPQRVAPPCRHFGVCGGCATQHMSEDLYAAWKRDIVVQAFAHRGLAAQVADLRVISTGSRRRAVFGVARSGDDIVLGFREEGRHRLVDLHECVILDRTIVAAMPQLRTLAAAILPCSGGAGVRLVVTRLDHGLDVAFETDGKPDAAVVQRIGAMAGAAGIVRLCIAGEVVLRAGPTSLSIGPARVEPPPGIFLQAVPEAERTMTGLVLGAVGKAKTVADLFCGLGTFTFSLARRARVLAVDSDKRAVSTLAIAAKATHGVKPIATKARDLFREPLSPRELDDFEVVVFDPPRAGAQAQCERLARSKVRTVVAVSCNPATLARDARLLIDGGYDMGEVTPIDQFIFTPHVEVIAAFRRR